MWGRGPGGYITITTTTKLQLQLQLHDNYNYNYNYTALKTAGEIERCREKVTESVRERGRGERERFRASTTFRSISGFALPSMHHNNSPLL